MNAIEFMKVSLLFNCSYPSADCLSCKLNVCVCVCVDNFECLLYTKYVSLQLMFRLLDVAF